MSEMGDFFLFYIIFICNLNPCRIGRIGGNSALWSVCDSVTELGIKDASWASLVAQLVKNPPKCEKPEFCLWVGKIPWRRQKLPTPVF